MITTPNQGYVSVTATAQTTAVTDVLPATGATDTTYRVGNWDGSQYSEADYTEYAWNGSAYVKLSTKSQIGEVYDISANHADTKYADLAAALGTNGANVPEGIRKGGMSVKFVQSSDNNYAQYRNTAADWSTNVSDWQGVDNTPISNSKNLLESGAAVSFYGAFVVSGEYNNVTEIHNYITYNNPFTIKAGTKLRILSEGIGTVVSTIRIVFATNQYVEVTDNNSIITVPVDCDTIIVGVRSLNWILESGGNISTSIYVKGSIGSYFGSGQNVDDVLVIDDLYIGGRSNILSAEQGKALNKKIIQHNWELTCTSRRRITELDGLPIGSKIYYYPVTDNSYVNVLRYYYTLDGSSSYKNIYPSQTVVIGSDGETPDYFMSVNTHGIIHLLVNSIDVDTSNNPFEYESISEKNLIGHNRVFLTANLTVSTTEGTDIFNSFIPKIPQGAKYHIDFAQPFSSWLNRYLVFLNRSESYTEYSVQNNTLVAANDITAIRVRIANADIISGQTPPTIDVELWWEDIAMQLSDIKEKADMVPALSENVEELNKTTDASYRIDNLQESIIYNCYLDAQGVYRYTINSGLVVYPVKSGDRFTITGHASRISYAGLVSSIANIADGNTANFMTGESIVTIPAGSSVSLFAKEDGYIILDLNNGTYPCAPQEIKRYVPLTKNVYNENIVNRKLICEAKATTSTTTYVDVIRSDYVYHSGFLAETIKRGTKMIVTVTGLSSTTTQKLVCRLNDAVSDSDFATKNGTFVMVAASDITKIRVIARNANVVSPSEVTVKIEIDDLGAALGELESKAVNILDVSKQSFIDANVDGYDSVNDKFTEGTYSVIIANSSNKTALSDVIANYVAKYTSSGDAYPYIQLNYNYSASNYWWKYPIGGKGFYKFGQCKCIFAGTQTLNSPWTDDIKIIITVPAGCELYIKNINAEYADGFVNKNSFKVDQHGTERNTVGADNRTNWDLWPRIGNYGAIVIPKRTTDGRWVCYHDDSFSESNNVQVIGNPSAPLPAASMQACTFAETQTLEYKSTNFYGDHDTIPTLDEFFAKCAQMGVHPALSCHPTSSSLNGWTIDKWNEVKALAQKYRVLDKLTIKCSYNDDAISNFYNVFGNDIEAFIADVSEDPTEATIEELASIGWDLDKVKVGFEILVGDAYFSDETIALFDANKLIHGIAPGSGNLYKEAKFLKSIIDKGCYEITADKFYSNGLNWG